ncbi:iron response transcriptional regulator IrrA [Emcibacter sp.]|uniref:iron response transcriptional regulator IrrA n=1 Tax=Emcibacter sp. TaxID=1979954 RepID=UPI002AA62B6C|nr:Fur family transcriptional regulator [Emcibacter sp.]
MSKVSRERPYARALTKLRDAGLRPTRQRLALAKLLFDGHDRHVTAEMLYDEAGELNASVSLATVYNTLHQFTDVGLLREVVVDSGRTYFDTNITEHYHFFHEAEGRLEDVPLGDIEISSLPEAPEGKKYSRVAVVIHVEDAS